MKETRELAFLFFISSFFNALLFLTALLETAHFVKCVSIIIIASRYKALIEKKQKQYCISFQEFFFHAEHSSFRCKGNTESQDFLYFNIGYLRKKIPHRQTKLNRLRNTQ